MLRLYDEPFASGVSSYVEEDPSFDSKQTSVHVNILVHGSVPIHTTARLDPATPWVVLNAELNEHLGLSVTSQQITLRTAEGLMTGSLTRYPLTLVAQDGDALDIEATLFICSEWRRGNFLGYTGISGTNSLRRRSSVPEILFWSVPHVTIVRGGSVRVTMLLRFLTLVVGQFTVG